MREYRKKKSLRSVGRPGSTRRRAGPPVFCRLGRCSVVREAHKLSFLPDREISNDNYSLFFKIKTKTKNITRAPQHHNCFSSTASLAALMNALHIKVFPHILYRRNFLIWCIEASHSPPTLQRTFHFFKYTFLHFDIAMNFYFKLILKIKNNK